MSVLKRQGIQGQTSTPAIFIFNEIGNGAIFYREK